MIIKSTFVFEIFLNTTSKICVLFVKLLISGTKYRCFSLQNMLLLLFRGL